LKANGRPPPEGVIKRRHRAAREADSPIDVGANIIVDL
jgi:hypothetical protein